jgi:hypothetical protein
MLIFFSICAALKEVMLHELCHNDFSEHDGHFWSLFRQLKREAESENWMKSRGQTVSGTKSHDVAPIEPLLESGQVLDTSNDIRFADEQADRRRLLDAAAKRVKIAESGGQPTTTTTTATERPQPTPTHKVKGTLPQQPQTLPTKKPEM